MYTKQEQKENRQKWVEALRSGKYNQTVGNLKDNKGFCCLGVACDISGMGEWEIGSRNSYSYRIREQRLSKLELPGSVQNWLGLTTSGGMYDIANLSSMNDMGSDFQEIADIIESEPAGLII